MNPFRSMCKPIACLVLLIGSSACGTKAQKIVIAELPTPIFSTAEFPRIFGGTDGATLIGKQCGSVQELEMIALPGSVFQVHETIRSHGVEILRVSTNEYPLPTWSDLYIDSRFVRAVNGTHPPRRPRPRTRAQILRSLESADGFPYFWGGNVRDGIPQLLTFYPPADPNPAPAQQRRWAFHGVDCSGLLYQATDGLLSRSTEFLVNAGEGLPIRGASAEAIAAMVAPLDLIVWNGHVLIVLDQNRVIQSARESESCIGGVTIEPLVPALGKVMKDRIPVNEYVGDILVARKRFVVRRWYKPDWRDSEFSGVQRAAWVR